MGKAISQALDAIARQPEAEKSISRLFFIGLAMIESAGHLRAGCGADRAVPQPAARIHARQGHLTMQPDWTTFLLQIVNFVVLVWLLGGFLYRPVMDVIARRREGIEEGARRCPRSRGSMPSPAPGLRTQLAEQDKTHAAEMSRLNDEVAAERARMARLDAELASERERHAAGRQAGRRGRLRPATRARGSPGFRVSTLLDRLGAGSRPPPGRHVHRRPSAALPPEQLAALHELLLRPRRLQLGLRGRWSPPTRPDWSRRSARCRPPTAARGDALSTRARRAADRHRAVAAGRQPADELAFFRWEPAVRAEPRDRRHACHPPTTAPACGSSSAAASARWAMAWYGSRASPARMDSIVRLGRQQRAIFTSPRSARRDPAQCHPGAHGRRRGIGSPTRSSPSPPAMRCWAACDLLAWRPARRWRCAAVQRAGERSMANRPHRGSAISSTARLPPGSKINRHLIPIGRGQR